MLTSVGQLVATNERLNTASGKVDAVAAGNPVSGQTRSRCRGPQAFQLSRRRPGHGVRRGAVSRMKRAFAPSATTGRRVSVRRVVFNGPSISSTDPKTTTKAVEDHVRQGERAGGRILESLSVAPHCWGLKGNLNGLREEAQPAAVISGSAGKV